MSTKRKQVTLAVVGSVGIHLVVLFAWAFTVQWFPAAQAISNQTPEQIQVDVVEEKPEEPPTPDLAAIPPQPTPPLLYKDTEDLPEANQPPKDPTFQSDRNSEAASELPATGDKPLPTQKGRPVPRFAFDTHPYIPGDAGTAAGQNVPENMPPPVRETAPPLPRAVSTPLSAATPAASVADPRDLAMVTPRSIPANPADAEPNPYDPSFRAPAGMTEPPRPTPVPRRGGYRPMQLRTEAAGDIDKIGAGGVSSEASPAGRYITSVKHAVSYRYHQYIDARADIIALGTVKVHFMVDRSGRVLTSRVVSNNANEALAAVSLRALADAQIPPMPTEVAAIFEGGVLPMDINFGLE